MSDDHSNEEQRDGGGKSGGGGGPDTSFLDFELHKVMYDEAEAIVREAYRELVKDAAKRRMQEVWGARIEALATLAVDEAMADADANLEIQALIESRNDAKRKLEQQVQAIIGGESSGGSGEAEAPAEDAS